MTSSRLVIFPAVALLLLSACADRSGLTVRSIEKPRLLYSTDLTAAYFARGGDGGYDVVLVHDPLDVPPKRADGGIAPAVRPPLRQIIHLRMLWRPRRVPQQRERLAANASIDWHLFGVGLEADDDYLHYQGAGFVTIDATGNTARVLIRRALIKPAQAHGRLTDPLGPSQVKGSMVAQRNPRQVARMLDEVRQRGVRLAAGHEEVIRHAGPPPRQTEP